MHRGADDVVYFDLSVSRGQLAFAHAAQSEDQPSIDRKYPRGTDL
jgi:hypothetical protein